VPVSVVVGYPHRFPPPVAVGGSLSVYDCRIQSPNTKKPPRGLVVSTKLCGFTAQLRPMFDSWYRQFEDFPFGVIVFYFGCRCGGNCIGLDFLQRSMDRHGMSFELNKVTGPNLQFAVKT